MLFFQQVFGRSHFKTNPKVWYHLHTIRLFSSYNPFLCVCLFIHLDAGPSGRLSNCLLVHRSLCLYSTLVCLSVRLPVCLPHPMSVVACLSVSLPVCFQASMRVWVCVGGSAKLFLCVLEFQLIRHCFAMHRLFKRTQSPLWSRKGSGGLCTRKKCSTGSAAALYFFA